jgi:hypothetical protein
MVLNSLVQSALLPIPKMDAHVAFAAGTAVSAPAASAPDTSAPRKALLLQIRI